MSKHTAGPNGYSVGNKGSGRYHLLTTRIQAIQRGTQVMAESEHGSARSLLEALLERACAVLQCDPVELRASRTPEGLVELRVARAFAERGPLSTTVVGTVEQIDEWLRRKAAEFGSDA